MQTQSYDLKGLAQANAVLTISNSVVMAQLAQMNVIMNTMRSNSIFYHRIKQTKQGPIESITVGAAGVSILMGVKPAQRRTQRSGTEHL